MVSAERMNNHSELFPSFHQRSHDQLSSLLVMESTEECITHLIHHIKTCLHSLMDLDNGSSIKDTLVSAYELFSVLLTQKCSLGVEINNGYTVSYKECTEIQKNFTVKNVFSFFNLRGHLGILL